MSKCNNLEDFLFGTAKHWDVLPHTRMLAQEEYKQLRATIATLQAERDELRASLSSCELMQAEAERFAPELKRQFDEMTATIAQQAAQLSAAKTALEQARVELRATQENWSEDCLYRADDILTKAIEAL